MELERFETHKVMKQSAAVWKEKLYSELLPPLKKNDKLKSYLWCKILIYSLLLLTIDNYIRPTLKIQTHFVAWVESNFPDQIE